MDEKTRVLIVEDEARIARFLQMELEHEGFEAETESNGTRAYERIIQEKFDIVLLAWTASRSAAACVKSRTFLSSC